MNPDPVSQRNQRFEDVYYVEAPEENRLSPIAINPEFTKKGVTWDTTSRKAEEPTSNVIFEEDGTLTPKKITIQTRTGERIVLWKMNVALYNEKVRNWVHDKPAFKSDEELKSYYLHTNFHQFG